jgi:hypothetical protein
MRALITSILLLALTTLAPKPADAYWPELCTRVWNACASVQNVQFVGNQMRFQMSYVSVDPGTETGWIRSIFVDLKNPATATSATVSTGGNWVIGNPGGFGDRPSWDVQARGQPGSTGIYLGQTATVVITFSSDVSNNMLVEWGANFQGLGPTGDFSEPAVVPEPITMVLLGTGLAGLGGVAALRRRREGEIQEE